MKEKMERTARVYYRDRLAGHLYQTDRGYRFTYDATYLKEKDARPISITLPLAEYPYNSAVLFPFFDGLIPEGWLLHLAEQHYKLRATDRFELLITLCRDTIGAVTVIPVDHQHQEEKEQEETGHA